MAVPEYALSIKQPWATLLVRGRKSIEVRRWPTARRGRVLIHAARVPDPRAEAWAWIGPELLEATRLGGGIIGEAELVQCLTYRDAGEFAADRPRHLNDSAWFEQPVLYGFVFANVAPVPFRSYPGWVRFFRVDSSRPDGSA
jgi:hypothetical protein